MWGVHLDDSYNLSRDCETTNMHCVHNISHCQVVAKFCRDYTVPARRDCSLIIALPWGDINVPVEFVIFKH